MLKYEGIFFEGKTADLIHSLEKTRLPRTNDEIHCTFKYRPNSSEVFDNLVGKPIEVLIVGYACDGKNSGFELQLPKEVMPYYINYDRVNPETLIVPHITASLAEGDEVKASDTASLTFEKLQNPIAVTGRFGYWVEEENREFVSYEQYNNSQEDVELQ